MKMMKNSMTSKRLQPSLYHLFLNSQTTADKTLTSSLTADKTLRILITALQKTPKISA